MPTPDDEQFAAYLKQFRPVAPTVLPEIVPARKLRSTWKLSALIAAATAIIVLAIVVMKSHREQIAANVPVNIDDPTHITAEAPLTMRNANKLLADAPSFKSAVDGLAFKSERIPLAKNEQSAVRALGKEKIGL